MHFPDLSLAGDKSQPLENASSRKHEQTRAGLQSAFTKAIEIQEVHMKDTTVRKLEMSIRVAGFLTANPIVFRKGSRGPELVVEFKRAVEEVQELSGKQMSAVAHTR